MRAFRTYHPLALLFYYLAVLLFSMFTMHPVLLLASLLGSVLFFCCMYAARPSVIGRNLVYYLFLFLLLAAVNPLFSHDGERILFFLNDNPVTMEAILYGGAIALLMISVIFWFKCFNEGMTSDKILYLFGKAIPKLSLILSMALRFVPLFQRQVEKINQAQKAMGLYTSESRTDRLCGSFRVFGAVLTWSLEHAVDTADSMKARGYGLKGRTNFAIFQFQARDGIFMGLTGALSLVVLAGIYTGAFSYHYYPVLAPVRTGSGQIGYYLAGFALMLMPAIIEIKENLQWKWLKSRI